MKWPFKVGDTVVTKEGEEVKVKEHKPDGFVVVRGKDGKNVTKFGGNLEPKDKGG